MSLKEWLDSYTYFFLDTAPVIYYIEENPQFISKVRPLFERIDSGTIRAVVSPITLAECLVFPYRYDQVESEQVFVDLLTNHSSVSFFQIDEMTAKQAAKLRATHNLTLIDSFQIAIAILAGCDAFVTNDIQLKRISEIPVLVIMEQ